MPTLKELLTQIEQHPKFVKIIDLNQDYIFYKFYTIYWKDNNLIKSSSICIYIDNRDLPNELAYFKDSIPELIVQPTLPTQQEKIVNDVKAKISEIITSDSTIEKVSITNSNQDLVEVSAYKYNSTTNSVSKINIVLYYDKDNKLIWRKIT